jgi:hypothetical protein
VIDISKGVGLADLILERIEQAQHQLGARTHRGADITEDHKLWFQAPLAMLDLDGDVAVF